MPAVNLEDSEEIKFNTQTIQNENFFHNDDLSSEMLNTFLKSDSSYNNLNIAGDERINCIKDLLRLDHLN